MARAELRSFHLLAPSGKLNSAQIQYKAQTIMAIMQ
jgi:hypothetical protein